MFVMHCKSVVPTRVHARHLLLSCPGFSHSAPVQKRHAAAQSVAPAGIALGPERMDMLCNANGARECCAPTGHRPQQVPGGTCPQLRPTRGLDKCQGRRAMVFVAPDVTYTITVDATFVLSVVLYHLLLLVVHIMLGPRKAIAPTPVFTEPERSDTPSATTDADVVTCRAPLVYFARNSGGCFHTSITCPKLRCAKSIGNLRPCSECCSSCTMHKKK